MDNVRRRFTVLATSLCGGLLLFGLSFFYTASSQMQALEELAPRLQPVPAIITESSIKKGASHRGKPVYSPRVQYQYQVAGQTYLSNKIYLDPDKLNHYKSPESARQANLYPIRQAVTAYYDTSNPELALLKPSDPSLRSLQEMGLLLMGIAPLLGGILLLIRKFYFRQAE